MTDLDELPESKKSLSSQLARLRRRFGNNVVDMLIEHHGGIEGDRAAGLFQKVDDLLAWIPDKEPFQWPHADIQPLEYRQLVTTGLPQTLLWMGAGILSCKGVIHDDPVQRSLLALGQALYPALLSQSDQTKDKDGPAGPLSARGLELARRTDELLRAEGLFPERIDRRSFHGRSTFNVYRHLEYLYEPSELLIHAAWELAQLRGQRSQRHLGEAICENLERQRSARAGRETFAPVFLGFAGVEVSAAFEINGLVIRPYDRCAHSSLLDWGQRLERFETPGFVVELSRPWRYSLARVDEPLPTDVEPIDWEETRRFAEILAAGHIVATAPAQLKQHELVKPSKVLPPPILRWAYYADPIYRSGSHHFATGWPLSTGGDGRQFDENSVRSALALRVVPDGSFQIALRRLAASVTPERRWSDCLVDAVIGWEALSGDCRGDVSFRVCSVIAHLISPPGSREGVRSILKKLYFERSQVVHAGAVLSSSQSRDAASLAGLVALRKLCGDPALLSEKDRFSALCLHH